MIPTSLIPVATSIFVLLIASQVSAQSPADKGGKGDYVIGSRDVLSITVGDQADLSGKFTVEADGSLTFPLIGRILAGGLTLRDLEAELRKRLADGHFQNPQASVAVEQYRSQRRIHWRHAPADTPIAVSTRGLQRPAPCPIPAALIRQRGSEDSRVDSLRKRTGDQLQGAKATVMGFVLNRVNLHRNPYYYSHYYNREYTNYDSTETKA